MSTAYAWSSKLGWVNFAPDTGGVSVTDSAITGYAWSSQSGWINLSPNQSGIKNNGRGVLSGSAWGAGTGWIDFSGVSINPSTGLFSGQAVGEVIGTLTFDCDQCHVVTTWRPLSSGGGGFVILPPTTPIVTTTPISTSTNPASPTTTSTNQIVKPTPITENLTVNTTDPQVKLLQQFLNTHGFPIALTGPGSPGNETDYFGQATKDALIKFQKANSISPANGIVGALTRAKILEIQNRETSSTSTGNTVSSPTSIDYNASNTAVTASTSTKSNTSIFGYIVSIIQNIVRGIIAFVGWSWMMLASIWRR